MNNKKSKTIGLIIGVIMFVCLLAGLSYAWLTFRTNNIIIAGNTSCFTINYSKGNDINENLNVINERDYVTSDTVTISPMMKISSASLELDEKCNKLNGLGTISLDIDSLGEAFTSDGDSYISLKYIVAEYNPEDYDDILPETLDGSEFTMVSKGNIREEGEKDIYNVYLEPGVVHNYLIILYIDSKFVGDDIYSDDSYITGEVTSRAMQLAPTSVEDFDYVLGSDVDGYVTEINYYYDENGDLTDEPTVIYPNEDYEIPLASNEVLLTKYLKNDRQVAIPNTYTINGTTYNTVLLSESYYFDGMTGSEVGTFPYESSDIEEIYLGNDVSILGTIYDEELERDVYQKGIMNYTFDGLYSLSKVPIIPSDVTYMYGTFEGCESLSEAPVIPSSVTDMSYTFDYCPSFTEAPVIPSSVTSMESTFSGCPSLIEAPIIPSSVTNMESTFSSCTSLTRAPVIPSSVTNMCGTFSDCSNLSGNVRIESSNVGSDWNEWGGHPFQGAGSVIVEVPNGSTTYDSLNTYKPDNVTLVTY